jgi:hypothetical protein
MDSVRGDAEGGGGGVVDWVDAVTGDGVDHYSGFEPSLFDHECWRVGIGGVAEVNRLVLTIEWGSSGVERSYPLGAVMGMSDAGVRRLLFAGWKDLLESVEVFTRPDEFGDPWENDPGGRPE